jgi:hypothetical protein
MAFVRNNNNGNNNNNRPRHNNYNNNRPRHSNGGHSNSGQNPNGGPRRHVSRINQVFESNGPEGRVRGTAQQIVEKYTTMGRDAALFGDRVLSMSYLQHAEHYQRLLNEITEENALFEKERDAQRQLQQAQPEVSTSDAEIGFVATGDQPQPNTAEQPQRAERPERTERPERAERPQRQDREDRPRPQQRERRPAHDVPDNELPSFLQVPIAAGKPEDGDKPARPAPVLRPRRIAPVTKGDDAIANSIADGPSDE